MMDARLALKKIRDLAREGKVFVSRHARTRAAQRGFRPADIMNVLLRGSHAEPMMDDRWCVHGHDCDGRDSKVVCVVEDDVIVITVYR